jgi:inward rectifier potassium channel
LKGVKKDFHYHHFRFVCPAGFMADENKKIAYLCPEKSYSMAKSKEKELGFGKNEASKRLINKDGSFNSLRRKTSWSSFSLYQYFLRVSVIQFFCMIIAAYITVNTIFAFIYTWIGHTHFIGLHGTTNWEHFVQLYYFSAQTFTTVGYGTIAPKGNIASIVATFEAMIGLLSFALATGLLYGRFSRPSAQLRFSENILLAPFKDGNALMFRIINERRSELIELECQITFGFDEMKNGKISRTYFPLELEVSKINFFPLSWTLVHPITPASPLWGREQDFYQKSDAEFYIIMKGYDDTYYQIVYSRFSYIWSEMKFGAKFLPAFSPNKEGIYEADASLIGAFEPATLNPEVIVTQNSHNHVRGEDGSL